jgi:hypothetical protein
VRKISGPLEGASKADGRERICCKRGLYSGRDFYNIRSRPKEEKKRIKRENPRMKIKIQRPSNLARFRILIPSYLILLIAWPNQQDLMKRQEMKEAGQKRA